MNCRNWKRWLGVVMCALAPFALQAQSMWDTDHLRSVKQSLHTPDYAPAYRALIHDADKTLGVTPESVMNKPRAAVSGDMHDYLSQARYTWPDPSKPDGLPYITRDGESNPEINFLDRMPLGRLAERVTTLSLAWYFSGDERYAVKAAELLRVWFLDPATRMNPNLNYAQVARGHHGDTGRPWGLIDTYSFVEMLDAVQLLEGSKSYPKREQKALRAWFREFIHWYRTHENGIAENNARNNHSVAYDAQLTAFALYVGDRELAREVLTALPERRIFPQIEPDGRQPQELRRTLAYHYSQYNLTHLIDLSLMAKKLGLRPDRAVSADGRGFYVAMNYLLGYTGIPQSEWPYKQISNWEGTQQNFCLDLYRTACWLDDPEGAYLNGFRAFDRHSPADRFFLVYGKPMPTDTACRLSEGWEYLRGDLGDVWEAVRPVIPAKPESVPLWTKVTLPHCFNATDAVDPDVNYYEGPGWYRTRAAIAEVGPGEHILLRFAGAGQKSELFVYTTRVASHTGGYDAWEVDITDAVAAFRADSTLTRRFGDRVPLEIRCDNSRDREMIPSDMSDFNLYGGIYRPLTLRYLPATYCSEVRLESTVDEAGTTGYLSYNLSLSGTYDALTLRLADPSGRTVAEVKNRTEGRLTLPKPALWSPDRPQCYTCTVELRAGGKTQTEVRRIGFRHFRFEEHGPFYLNGERLLLRGTHRHEDHAGVGAAMSDAQIVAEMQQIKAMGANFIRLGHYQQTDAVLDACDSLGILVWEEIPWCRGGLGGETYRAQARRMLENMIMQHRHHPSIILWGLGNENDWPGDFETFSKEEIHAFMSELHALAHGLDDTRLTSIRRCEFCKDAVDVYSPSIWAGWYGRRYTNYYEMERKGFENARRFLHVEWGADSHAGRHTERAEALDIERGDSNGDWSETYAVLLFDWHLKEQERMPWLTGTAFWTFKDFSTPLRPDNPIPYVNQKGVVQRDGTPKESYYVFQSYWAQEPMVHIYGHSRPVRWGAEGEEKEVWVYSNCPEVELLVNGVSAGVRQRNSQDFPAAGLHWTVTLREGENRIEAIARTAQGAELRDAIDQRYTSAVGAVSAQLKISTFEADGAHYVEALICDQEGRPCLESSDFIRFGATDPRALVRCQGTATGSDRIQAANGRAVIRIREGFPAVISARCETGNIRPAYISVEF